MKVPVYEEQVAPRPLPQPDVGAAPDANALGAPIGEGVAALGRGVQSLSDTVSRIAYEEKEKADAFRSDDALLKYHAATNQALRNSQNGFLNQQGENALDAQPTKDQILKAREQLLGSLQNDEQRRRFTINANQLDNQTLAQVETHVAGQRQQVYESVAEGTAKNAADSAFSNYNNPDAIEKSVQALTVDPAGGAGPVRRALMAKGIPAEQISAIEKDAAAKVYESALKGYVAAQDGEGGLKYLATIKDKLGPEATSIEHQLNEVYKANQSEGIARAIVDASVDKRTPNGWIDPNKAIALSTNVPVALSKDVRERLDAKLADNAKRKSAYVDQQYAIALAAYRQHGASAIPPQVKAELQSPLNDPTAWERLRNIMTADVALAKGLPPTPQQQINFIKTMTDMDSNPGKYLNMSPEALVRGVLPDLHPTQGAEIQKAFDTLHKGSDKDAPLSSLESSFLLAAGRKYNFLPDKGEPSTWNDPQKAAIFAAGYDELKTFRAQYKALNGKEPPAEEMQSRAEKAMMPVTVPAPKFLGIFGGSKDISRVEADKAGLPAQVKDIDHVPFNDRVQIENALRSTGKPVTDEAILDRFNRANGLQSSTVSATPPESKPTAALPIYGR